MQTCAPPAGGVNAANKLNWISKFSNALLVLFVSFVFIRILVSYIDW